MHYFFNFTTADRQIEKQSIA